MARGAREVKRRLTSLVGDITSKKSYAAATAAAIVIQSEAALRTPVDTSYLINSQFRRVIVNPDGAQAFIGYTAAYALAVHEASGKLKGQPRADFGKTREGVAFGGGTGQGNYWDPAGEPKFLENAARESTKVIDSVVKKALEL